MAHVIKSVNIRKNPATVGEEIKITVEVITWEYLNRNYTWDTLQDSNMKWQDLKK